MASNTDPLGTASFNFNGVTVTIVNSYYVEGESYFDLQYADGSIATRIPQNSVAANPVTTDDLAAGDQ